MNAKGNMPGFTAEHAIFKTTALYRTAGVFESSDPAYVMPAMSAACYKLLSLWAYSWSGSYAEAFFWGAAVGAGCRLPA
jgi:hypothetical protein